MKRLLAFVAVATLTMSAAQSGIGQETVAVRSLDSPAASPIKPSVDGEAPLVQLAILLDNSGSMNGLIEQARSELWRVVNELTTVKQNGRQPRLQVALYTYGSPPPKRLLPLTEDLDKVSESLFAVTISGGTEYCGQVIESATNELQWSTGPNDLKLIFIAGNEPFTQGPVPYQTACRNAIAKGIIVNTIHCGAGLPHGWRDGAMPADGKAMSINQNTQTVHIEAPQDSMITQLSVQLNSTYVPFGDVAAEAQSRQTAQDSNASSQSLESSVQLAVSKANAYYRNSSWDLVDAVKEGSVELAKVKEGDLPKNMQEMNVKQRREFVEKQGVARIRIQGEINKLNSERTKFVTEKRKELVEKNGEETLDKALVEAIRSQASAKDFRF